VATTRPERPDPPLRRCATQAADTRETRGSRLPDRLSAALRARHYSRRTELTCRLWVRRYIYFHNVRHPAEMGEAEINAFLTHLAVRERVAASTQVQALAALLFLYWHIIGRPVGDLGDVIRARKPTRLPVVMTREEVKARCCSIFPVIGGSWPRTCMERVCA
jgi:site-specific recombinase XerD